MPHIHPGAGPGGPQAPNPLAVVTAPQTLLILAPEVFMAALGPLVQHKNQTGMPTTALSLESVMGYFPGVDSPEKIKRAILYAYQMLSTKYVMLVGDATQFPVRYWFLQGAQYCPPPYTTAVMPCEPPGNFVQSDLYYANLFHHTGSYPQIVAGDFDNWDQNGNGLYNEAAMTEANPPFQEGPTYNPDNVDGYPDLCVGRVPAAVPQDVMTYVSMVITYETTISPAHHNGLTFTLIADAYYPNSIGLTNGLAANSGLAEAAIANVNYTQSNGETSVPGYANVSSAFELANQAGQSAWVSYIGHGGFAYWDNFGQTDVSYNPNLTNFPVVFASACESGAFTIMPPWGQPYTYTDLNGDIRGPFSILNRGFADGISAVVEDQSTGQEWGTGPGTLPLPAMIPIPNPINSPLADSVQSFANSWLFHDPPGGGIAYFGEHCVTSDNPGAELETTMLARYLAQLSAGGENPILGDLYLSAQQAFYGNHVNDDMLPPGSDYHTIPRLYLGWMIFFGDPSLRLPMASTLHVPVNLGASDGTSVEG